MQRKLLLVDDEVGILRALRRLFRRAGYEIFVAESAEEALELLAVEEIPLILSDFRMPGADGGTLLQRAVELDPPCVGMILSGFAELKQVLGAFNTGAVHRFVSKPWIDTELLELIESAFHVADLKRSDIDLDRSGLLDQLQQTYKRFYPLNLVDELDSRAGREKQLFVVEFAAPRKVLAGKGFDTKQALASLVTELVAQLPETTAFCHWNGYTLMLLLPSSDADLVEIKLQAQADRLRWVSSPAVDLSGADRMRHGLLALAHTEPDRVEFASSGWSSLLDAELSDTVTRAINDQSFSVVFQPVCADSGELRGLEALVRCPAITASNLLLGDGIRQIELLGYSDPFTDLQLGAALADFRKLQLPDDIKLVLNFSMRQCSSPHFRHLLTQHLSASGMRMEQLSIDISESTVRSRIPGCLENLEWLRSSGVELTLDDQGSAHAYLNSEDVHIVSTVKLDREFLHELDTHANRQEMLLNLCNRIEQRGKRLSFEGVENKQQLSFLKEHFRFTYQGYALAKPMAIAELQVWFANQV